MQKPPRILIVEDEPLIAQILEDWLEELGCEVVGPARSVEAALNHVANDSFQAAILDVKVIDGVTYEVGDALKARGIPFAVATGYGDADRHPSFSSAQILEKPFDFAVASTVIKDMLSRAQSPSAQ